MLFAKVWPNQHQTERQADVASSETSPVPELINRYRGSVKSPCMRELSLFRKANGPRSV